MKQNKKVEKNYDLVISAIKSYQEDPQHSADQFQKYIALIIILRNFYSLHQELMFEIKVKYLGYKPEILKITNLSAKKII